MLVQLTTETGCAYINTRDVRGVMSTGKAGILVLLADSQEVLVKDGPHNMDKMLQALRERDEPTDR